MVGEQTIDVEANNEVADPPDPATIALSYILASVHKDGRPNIEKFTQEGGMQAAEIVRQNDDGHYQIRFHPPQGGAPQDYIQVGHLHGESGFHGVMWQRCNPDSTVFTDDNGPHTFVVLPGSDHGELDNETGMKAIKGDDISYRYADGRRLGQDVARYLNENSTASHGSDNAAVTPYGQGQITVVSNSLGALAGPAVVASLQEQLGADAVGQHVLLNPFLPTRALYETAEYFVAENGTPEEADRIREQIVEATIACRPEDPTVVTRLSQTGDYGGRDGNDLYGRQMWSVDTVVENEDQKLVLTEYTKGDIFNHAPQASVTALYQEGAQAFSARAIEDDERNRFSPEESIENTGEYNMKVGLFMGLNKLFNSVKEQILEFVEGYVSKFLDAQDFGRESFYDVSYNKVEAKPEIEPDAQPKVSGAAPGA